MFSAANGKPFKSFLFKLLLLIVKSKTTAIEIYFKQRYVDKHVLPFHNRGGDEIKMNIFDNFPRAHKFIPCVTYWLFSSGVQLLHSAESVATNAREKTKKNMVYNFCLILILHSYCLSFPCKTIFTPFNPS